jgi:hypothetical protein
MSRRSPEGIRNQGDSSLSQALAQVTKQRVEIPLLIGHISQHHNIEGPCDRGLEPIKLQTVKTVRLDTPGIEHREMQGVIG